MPQDEPAILTDAVRTACMDCIGNIRETTDTLAPETAAKLDVLLGHKGRPDTLPPTWHWAYFNSPVAEADQNEDLHERTGSFLPPAPFPRRMWASGELSVMVPLVRGIPAQKKSVVADVSFKQGKTGAMCFVSVAHEIRQSGTLCIRESQTIVYRDRTTPEPALRQPDDPVPDGYFVHSDSMLFFYSALTHNGHRIHWDRAFCRDVEGYPDLVVHGPLMATRLCEAMRDGANRIDFSYRAMAPVFVTTPVRLVPGAPGALRTGQIERSDGVISMQARLRRL